MEELFFTNAVNISKDVCKNKLKKGDIAVDATMGNGNDTLFLCKLVEEEGKVYSFDIQMEALKSTEKKLYQNNIHWAELILDGHENMDKYLKGEPKIILFNLGYLPGNSKEVTTKKDTTLEAVKKSLDLIKKEGVIILVIYPGHEEGMLEKKALIDFCKGICQKQFNVIKLQFVNQINNPPMMICIEKRK